MKLLHPVLLALALCAGAGSCAAAKPAASKARTAHAKKTAPHPGPAAARHGVKARAHAKATKAAARHAYHHVEPKVDYEGQQVDFTQWSAVTAFADEVALRHGFVRTELEALFAQVHYVDSAVQLVKPAPPGKPKNWQAYRELTIEPVRVGAGVKFWNENAATLARAEAEYGVPAEIVAGIIGVETVYGRNTGRFRVLDVLTTLAFAYPDTPNRAERMAFFRDELENTLVLARQNHVDPLTMLGSFAGAVGMPQFMPGSVLAYGVDYDHDGVIDLRNSAADAIGSVANFLVQHGWQRQETGPLVYPAHVSPSRAWERFLNQGLSARFTARALNDAGVVTDAAPAPDLLFGLVDLQNGADPTDYWLANDNFFAITQYNRSYFYAMAVIELGHAVKVARAEAPAA